MAKTKLYIANKFRFICAMVFILLFVLFGVGMIFKINVAEGVNELKYTEIHIKAGDTLWDLAKKFKPEDKEIRRVVYDISLLNQLNTLDVYPGQVIKIPVQ